VLISICSQIIELVVRYLVDGANLCGVCGVLVQLRLRKDYHVYNAGRASMTISLSGGGLGAVWRRSGGGLGAVRTKWCRCRCLYTVLYCLVLSSYCPTLSYTVLILSLYCPYFPSWPRGRGGKR